MKVNTKYILLFLGFMALLTVSVPSIYNNKAQNEAIDIYHLGNSQVSWNVSEYVNFTGPPIDTRPPRYFEVFRIFINDIDPNYTWSKTVAENEWCTGSGVAWNPYIIEGLYIDAQGDGGGICIRNSDKHFIIRNCWVNNSGLNSTYHAGVFIYKSKNGIIKDNIFTYTKLGVLMEFYCSNIIVSGNYMISDPSLVGRAISCAYDGSNILIDGNAIVNFYDGMFVHSNILNCTLSHNYVANFIYEEWEDAPVRFSRVNDSSAIYNILDGVYTQLGVFVQVLGGGGSNIIINNTVVPEGEVKIPDIPILNSVPTMQNSDRSAVNLQDCYSNLIAHNRVVERDSESVSDSGIPGYDVLLTVSLVGIVGIVLVIRQRIKKLPK